VLIPGTAVVVVVVVVVVVGVTVVGVTVVVVIMGTGVVVTGRRTQVTGVRGPFLRPAETIWWVLVSTARFVHWLFPVSRRQTLLSVVSWHSGMYEQKRRHMSKSGTMAAAQGPRNSKVRMKNVCVGCTKIPGAPNLG
jgi:hypothetical protein